MSQGPGSGAAFESGAWRQLCSLVDDQDVTFLDSVFQTYLRSALEHLATLRSGQDTEAQRRAAHTLLGSSLSIGVTSIATICRKLELELGRSPILDMPERLAKIEEQLELVRQQYPVALAQLLGAPR